MNLGLSLFAFLVGLLIVSIGPLKSWRLDEDDPLNEDDLRWAAAGYGSASVSLNCLFGAYSVALILVGYACFLGVVTGVVGALLLLNHWIARGSGQSSFQAFLYERRLFESIALDRSFWLILSGCQFGLALSELVLLNHVFSSGVGMPFPLALVASLCVACAAYFYCMIGGYNAVFRTDALQYLMLLLMGGGFLLIALGSDLSFLEQGVPVRDEPGRLLTSLPSLIRDSMMAVFVFEFCVGLALGAMPVLAAPDAWKRVSVVHSKRLRALAVRAKNGPDQRSFSFAQLKSRLACISPTTTLLLALGIPLALTTPLVIRLSRYEGTGWSLPLHDLMSSRSPVPKEIILLGLAAAFMSTFDGALVSAVHVLLKQRTLPGMNSLSESARYQVLVGLLFGLIALSLGPVVSISSHPYVIGAFLIGPFGMVGGVLIGTGLGRRRIAGEAAIYLFATIACAWLWLVGAYLNNPLAASDPFTAAPIVFSGCGIFFLCAGFSRILSRPNHESTNRARMVKRAN